MHIRLGLRRAAFAGKVLIGRLANRLRARQRLGRHILRRGRVSRGLAAAQRNARVFRPEVGTVVIAPAAAAISNLDVSGQRQRAVIHAFCNHRAQLRISHPRRAMPAGHHHVRALAVIAVARVDAAHEAEIVHLLGRVRQQFGNVNARHAGLDGAERPAGIGVRLRIPALELAQPARHAHHNHALLFLGQAGQRFLCVK